MKCSGCGFNNKENVYFCKYCGRYIKDLKEDNIINRVYLSIINKVSKNIKKV